MRKNIILLASPRVLANNTTFEELGLCSSIRQIGYLLQLVYRMPSIFVVVAALLF